MRATAPIWTRGPCGAPWRCEGPRTLPCSLPRSRGRGRILRGLVLAPAAAEKNLRRQSGRGPDCARGCGAGRRDAARAGLRAGIAAGALPGGGRPELEAILVNTAGGMAGGDRFDIAVTAGGRRAALGRHHRGGKNLSLARTRHDLSPVRVALAGGARLRWLPQETILFDRGRLARSIEVEMEESASLLLAESLCSAAPPWERRSNTGLSPTAGASAAAASSSSRNPFGSTARLPTGWPSPLWRAAAARSRPC